MTPDVVTTTSEPVVDRHRHRDQHRRPSGPRRDGPPRARRGGHVVGGPAHQPGRRERPVPAGRRLHHGGARTAARPECSVHPDGAAALGDRRRRWASTNPASTRFWSTSTAPPTTALPPVSTTLASCCPCSGCPPEPASDSSADALADVVAPDTSKPVRVTMLVAAGRPAAAGRGRAGRDHPGAADRRRARHLAGEPAGGSTPCCRRPNSRPARGRPRRGGEPRAVSGRRSRPVGHRQRDDGRLRRQRRTRRRARQRRPTPAPGRRPRSNWLNRLKALAQRMCVAPTNYAQADLDALQRVGDPGLASIATTGAGDIVDQILGITVNPRRHPARRRPADRSARSSCSPRRARPSRSPPPTSPPTTRRAVGRATADVTPRPLHPGSGRRAVRPGRRRRTGRASVATRRRRRIWMPRWTFRLAAGLRGGAPPGRAGLAAVAHASRRDAEPRTQILMPPMDMGPASRRCGGGADRGGHHHPRGSGRTPPADRGDRRGRVGAAARLRPLPDQVSANPRARFDDAVTSGIAR